MKVINQISILLLGIILISCENEKSLQEYYVTNQDNKEFVAMDMPASYFIAAEDLDDVGKNNLNTIKKVNLLAFPVKEDNSKSFEKEKRKISTILSDEKYQQILKIDNDNKHLQIYYTGNDTAVDEVIVYGFDDTQGLGLARLLGDNMHPNDIAELVKLVSSSSLNSDKFQEFHKIFRNNN